METGFIISGCTKDEFFVELKHLLSKVSTSQAPDKLLTQTEACKYLRVSKPTLIAWTKQGVIKSTKLERRVYYKETDLLNISK
jgi:excisionase family DNA binding protein